MTESAAICGIGATEISRNSGRSELRLAVEAAQLCLADAGIDASEIDGFVTMTLDATSEIELKAALGTGDIRYATRIPFGGGGGCGAVATAARAIEAGAASTVLIYRALNSASGIRYGSTEMRVPVEFPDQSAYISAGLLMPASRVALTAQHYLHRYGLPDDSFAGYALQARAYAVTNPRAIYYQKPLTMEEYLASPWVSRPLRRHDCCPEADGGAALLITSAPRARAARHRPAYIVAATQAFGDGQQTDLAQYNRPDILELPEIAVIRHEIERQLRAPLTSVDAAMFYDHFTPLILMQIEQLGFCDAGEGAAFIRDGNIAIGGALPLNTHGGHFGEGYLHGMNGLIEGVRQLRGDAANPVPDARSILMVSAAGTPSSAVVIASDPRT